MFRKKGKDKEDKKGRFTLGRSKSKKKIEHVTADSCVSPNANGPSLTHANSSTSTPSSPATASPFNSAEYLLPQEGVQARALYEYDPEQDDEIQLKEGDLVIVYERDESGWWTGECRGKYGLFPGAFVALLDEAAVSVEAATLQPNANPHPGGEEPNGQASHEEASAGGGGSSSNNNNNAGTEENGGGVDSEELKQQEGGDNNEPQPEHHAEEHGEPQPELEAAPQQEDAPIEPLESIDAQDRSRSFSSAETGPPTADGRADSPPEKGEAEDGNGATVSDVSELSLAWEQERAEWEKYAQEWELNFNNLNTDYEALRQERDGLVQQLQELTKANEEKEAVMQALQNRLAEEKLISENEKATADDLLRNVQRLEEQVQELERERAQAKTTSLSAETNAQEVARLRALLSDLEKEKESTEQNLEEARKRSAELEGQVSEERRLRREAEQSLEQVKKEAHEQVAKAEESLMRHLQETKTQLTTAISASNSGNPRPSPVPSGLPRPASPASGSNSPAAAPGSPVLSPMSLPPAGRSRPMSTAGLTNPPHRLRPTPRAPIPASVAEGLRPIPRGPITTAPGHGAVPIGPHAAPEGGASPGATGNRFPQPIRPSSIAAGQAIQLQRGIPPTRGSLPPGRGRGIPAQRPHVPPDSQKPTLSAPPGARPLPAGVTARAAVSRPPPGRPRGAVPSVQNNNATSS